MAGLLSNKNGGSRFVIYIRTDTWKPAILLNLQDVSPDNYGAISTDGNYIAYTKWDENNVRRYLEIYSLADGKVKSFYNDMPARNEIIKISWLPDNKTLLFIRNDASIPYYQQIQTLNVQTGEENILVKGEVWRINTVEESVTTAEDFYLKGHQSYLKVKEKEKIPGNGKNTIEWNYYLNQNDVNEIYLTFHIRIFLRKYIEISWVLPRNNRYRLSTYACFISFKRSFRISVLITLPIFRTISLLIIYSVLRLSSWYPLITLKLAEDTGIIKMVLQRILLY